MPSVICPNCSHTVEIQDRRKRPLTKRQRELYDYVRTFSAAHGYAPTYEEMRLHFDCAVGSIVGLIAELRKRGWVSTSRQRARSITVLEDQIA